MRARDYARQLLASDRLADKLAPPPDGLELDDDEAPLWVAAPSRPSNLAIQPGRAGRVPPLTGMRDRHQRARIVHALANHELQAAELFAWALLAFPHAPRPFRTGLVAILADEQRHLALYRSRLHAHGVEFGDFPVTGHFWGKLDAMATPLAFSCAMGLTFENANLDFAQEYAQAARAVGDDATADVLDQVHADEIRHVRFAFTQVGRLAPDRSPWQVYCDTVQFPLGPARARGLTFDADARRKAGLDDEFIAGLEAARATQASGAPRRPAVPQGAGPPRQRP
ncbi:MAG: DUF455 family protein [Kofleriaceae bacterium]|jgi:uncharacterized ferritin-like protein (DUF455 family)|nr:DUF455 family protein [Kofleriaceae bacterium]MBP6837167.1 DUF455 family protein [Kofleriaceae bacterium]MBP9202521.1 DUF455 family protein [Kofleriaceae bacterium]